MGKRNKKMKKKKMVKKNWRTKCKEIIRQAKTRTAFVFHIIFLCVIGC